MSDVAAMLTQAGEAYERRRYDLAAGLYRRLSELEPERAGHQLRLGNALQRLGCRVMAAEAFRRAAELLCAAGDRASALAACRTAMSLGPADTQLRGFYESLSHIPQLTDAQQSENTISARVTLHVPQSPPPAPGDARG